MKESLATVIVSQGRVIRVTLPRIVQMLRQGLTIADFEMLALVADEHRMTVPELMRRALEGRAA